jgi:hypothetical protein
MCFGRNLVNLAFKDALNAMNFEKLKYYGPGGACGDKI